MEYLIGALVGSIIGYITNWLAIKMLFRPHEEKRFLGIKVPFTPGLIPKERERIAKSVGEAVGTHLLTKEQLVDRFTSDSMAKEIDNWLKKEINLAASSEKTIKEKLQEFVKDEYSSLKVACQSMIFNKILAYIRTKKTKEKITIYIVGKISDILERNPRIIIENSIYIKLKEKIVLALSETKDNNQTSGITGKLLQSILNPIVTEDRPLKEVMKEGIVDGFKNLIINNSKPIAKELKKALNEESTKEEIKNLVNKVIATQLNPMVAMFVKPDNISEKVYIFINEELEKDESQIKVAQFICKFLDKGIEMSPAKIAYQIDKNLSENTKETVIKKIENMLLCSQNVQILVDNLEEIIVKKNTIKELFGEQNEEFISIINSVITNMISTVIESVETEEKVREIINELIKNAEEIKLGAVINNSSKEVRDSMVLYGTEFLITLVKEKGETALETVDLAKIVEDNINSFDVDYAEKIIIDIAQKELNAITWLGALLGAIMGLLSPVINSFM
ncbi:DUF445 domain-containing protein [Clostridium cellulovorans]|uniref:DUF445 family protein n=1 Tax=Clostridium cellulovorans (strain ATCC 35296 / DSM 3052 / OCM 3 / 743B) TaxID=573061 RepID=D9SPQ1_CLOC7|nr:DUF445 domain-containing protein [Clostridium cellulovorans]ADL50100.1 protein of unknown function DUF445 [Clostridium cellulovorans 743B]